MGGRVVRWGSVDVLCRQRTAIDTVWQSRGPANAQRDNDATSRHANTCKTTHMLCVMRW